MNIAVVIVAFDEGADLTAVLDELGRQREPGDEVVVAHNSPGGTPPPGVSETAAVASAHDAVDRLVETGDNLGFGGAANLGAAATSAETLLFLNPDCVPEPGCLEALRRPPDGWDAWMGLVALEDGKRVNTAGGVLHFLGFGWTERYGEPIDAVAPEPAPVGFLSGACLAIRRSAWDAVGGFPDSFFVYVEDVDISYRLRLQGREFGVLPEARLRHGYEFSRRPWKFRELERNRWLSIVRCYPGRLLALVLPALLVVEPAMLAYAASEGWGRAKIESIAGFLRALPGALRERREIQSKAVIGPAEFAAPMQAEIDSPFIGGLARARPVSALLRIYWALVTRLAGGAA